MGANRLIWQNGSGRAGPSTRKSVDNQIWCKGNRAVKVTEIRMIEDIIDLPSKLNLAFLTQAYVLKECQIRIEDRGQPKLIALQAADTPRNTRFGEASGIDRIGQSGIVRGADPCIRVAQQNRSRVAIAARKVCDGRPGTANRATLLQ